MFYVIAAAAFGLLLVLRKRNKIPALWAVRGALALLGGSALAETGLGGWIAGLVTGLAGWVSGVVGGGSATLFVGVVMLILAVITVYDVAIDRKVDKPAMTGLILLPILFLAAAGPLASAGLSLTGAVNQLGVSLSSVIGG